MEASKFGSPERDRPEWVAAEPFEWDGEVEYPAERAPEPFWGRFMRAVGLLLLAIAAHLWLGPPEPSVVTTTALQAASTAISRRSPAPQSSPVAAAAVKIITELVPVGTTGLNGDSRAITLRAAVDTGGGGEPVADATTPAVAVSAETRSDGTAVLEARPDGPSDVATPPLRSAGSVALAPLPLTHVLSSRSLHQPFPFHLPATASAKQETRPPEPRAEPDRQRVKELLDEYVAAFERLDAEAAKAVWPSVDDKALRRAFQQLETQRLTFQSCGITIDGSDANALCKGQASYRPRVGSRTLRIATREWTFNLAKADAGWQIVDAKVR